MRICWECVTAETPPGGAGSQRSYSSDTTSPSSLNTELGGAGDMHGTRRKEETNIRREAEREFKQKIGGGYHLCAGSSSFPTLSQPSITMAVNPSCGRHIHSCISNFLSKGGDASPCDCGSTTPSNAVKTECNNTAACFVSLWETNANLRRHHLWWFTMAETSYNYKAIHRV